MFVQEIFSVITSYRIQAVGITQLCICCSKWHCGGNADGDTYTFVFVTMANIIPERSVTLERKCNMTTTVNACVMYKISVR